MNVNIAQKEVQLTWNPSEFTYDGAVHQPEAIPEGVLDGDDVIVNISGGAADAGNYTAEAVLGGSLADNYVLTGETEYAFTIQQAASTISLAVAEDLVYNGAAQALVDYVEFEGGTLLFSLDGENWSEDQPTALHAGTYTVYYKVDGGNNYTGTETTSFDIEIAQAVVGIEWGQTEFVYNGSEQAPTAAVTGLFGDDTCTATVTGAETNAGTYTAVASDLSNTDYVLSNDTDTAFTIEQKTVDFTWDETQLVYTGEEIAPNVILNGVLDGDDCTAIVNGAQTEPGTYIAQVTGLNNSNYKLGNGTSQTAFSIYKEEYVVIFDANGGSGSKIKTKIGGAYTLKTFEEYGFAAPEHQKFAGWDVEGTVYQAGDEIVISDVTLIKALWEDAKQYQTAIAFDDNKIEKTFGDDTFTNELTGAETAVSYSSSDPSVATVDENGIVTIVGAGSAVITADAAEDDAFFAASASYRVLVAKAAITPSVSITGWTEGDTANAPVVTGNDGSGDVTFAYKVSGADDNTYSDAVPETAGTYTVKAIIAESANYQGGSAEADFTIAEAAPQIQAELISSNTVSFKENIMLNFYADIDAEHAEGAYVIFSYSHYGEPKEVRVELNPNQTLRSGGKTYYVFGCPLSVAELAIDVNAKLYLADSDDAVSEQVSSVTAYCERMLERSSTNEVTKNALKALLNFGGYTQIALNLNTDKLANENYQSDVSDITAEVSGEFVKPTEKIGGVQYAGMQLVMRDAVVARYVFHVDSLEGVKFFVNGVEVTPKKSNNLYYIDADPVKAMNLS